MQASLRELGFASYSEYLRSSPRRRRLLNMMVRRLMKQRGEKGYFARLSAMTTVLEAVKRNGGNIE